MSESRKKNLEFRLVELENNLKTIIDGMNKLSSRLDTKIKELNTLKPVENPFDFSDIDRDDENALGEFLHIAEKNIVKFENIETQEIVNNIKDGYPFILKGELKLNDNNPSMINALFKDRDDFNQRIDKINEKYDDPYQ